MGDEGDRRPVAPAPPAGVDGWAAHEDAQRRAWQRTTARERLAWLEDAKRFAARALEVRRAAANDGDAGG
jgi:hypothetical protein